MDNNSPSPKEKIFELSKPKTSRWLSALAFDWLTFFIALSSIKWVNQIWFSCLAVFYMGTRIHGIFVLGHDGAHYKISRNKKLNDFLANTFCFIPFGYQLQGYRKWHLAHHNNLGTEKDSEVSTIKKWLHFRWKLPTNRNKIITRSLLGLTGLEAYDIFVAGYIFRPTTLKEGLTNFSFLIVLGTALYHFNLGWTLPYIAASVFMVLPVLNYLRTLFEHTGSTSTLRLKLNWLERALISPHHILEYHFEHHKWASIPFYNLPQARDLDKTTPILTLSEQVDSFQEGKDAEILPVKSSKAS